MANIPQKQQHRNEVHLSGIMARDPEVKYTSSGKAFANFSVATTYQQRTEYHRCVAWEEQAEKLGEKFHKGDYVRIVGRLATRSWDDKQTGQKKYVTEVIVWNVSDGTTEKNLHGVEVSDSDIPF